jgi:hypothetical protein
MRYVIEMIQKKKRLLQVARQTGVGLTKITDFLAEKGITIGTSPNTPLSPEVYEIIEREFGGGSHTRSSQSISERMEDMNGDAVSLGNPDCGFRSRSAFYASFKKYERVSTLLNQAKYCKLLKIRLLFH